MSTLVKVILGIIVAIVLVVILAVAGVYLWWQKGGGKEMGKEFIQNAEKSEKEGKDYGLSTDKEGCVSVAMARNKKDSSFSGALATKFFLQGCLKSSKETPGFCTTVPKPTQIIDSVNWQVDQCKKRGAANDQMCPQVMKTIQDYCYLKN